MVLKMAKFLDAHKHIKQFSAAEILEKDKIERTKYLIWLTLEKEAS